MIFKVKKSGMFDREGKGAFKEMLIFMIYAVNWEFT